MIADTPQAPYYAVIFTSVRSELDQGYADMAQLMVELARLQPGFLGLESARQEIGITISYWSGLEAIRNWKNQADHQIAQKLGREKWYNAYKTRICLVERDYGFESDQNV